MWYNTKVMIWGDNAPINPMFRASSKTDCQHTQEH